MRAEAREAPHAPNFRSPATHVSLTLMSAIASGLTLYGSFSRNREIRFLALFQRPEPVALPELARGVDRHGADRVVKRNGLIGPDD